MKNKFKISLKQNGIHSLENGLDRLKSYEESKDEFLLKEAIMFLHHGIELLMKQVLVEKAGEFLIYADISEETTKKVIKAKSEGISVFSLPKPIYTATYLEVIGRVKAFIDTPELEESVESKLKELNRIRNNIEHYGIDDEIERIENLIYNLKKPLIIFFEKAITDFKKEDSKNINKKWEELYQDVILEASRLRGGASLKRVEFNDGNVVMEYVKNFDEYKRLNPRSMVTQAQLKAYWKSGDAIMKALIDGSARIMRKLDFVNRVKIIFPTEEKIYTIDVRKDELEKFIGAMIPEIRDDWDNKFSDRYVYSQPGRNEFFNEFGIIE